LRISEQCVRDCHVGLNFSPSPQSPPLKGGEEFGRVLSDARNDANLRLEFQVPGSRFFPDTPIPRYTDTDLPLLRSAFYILFLNTPTPAHRRRHALLCTLHTTLYTVPRQRFLHAEVRLLYLIRLPDHVRRPLSLDGPLVHDVHVVGGAE